MFRGYFNWNKCFIIYYYWLNRFISDWNEMLTINLYNWSRSWWFCNRQFNFISKNLFIYFRYNWNRNICFWSYSKSINLSIFMIRSDHIFINYWVYFSMNWNINFSFNFDILRCSICYWFVCLTIDANNIFIYWLRCCLNWFVFKYW
jgi:hypothetical protein